MQMRRVAFLLIQKTGAPINRSRSVPPPTPVTTAKKMKVTRSGSFLCRDQRSRHREHADPEIIQQDKA